MKLIHPIRLALLIALLFSSLTGYALVDKKPYSRLFYQAAKAHNVPVEVLKSICQLESKGNPWAVNVNGIGFQPDSKQEAIALLENTQKRPWVLTIEYRNQKPTYSFFSSKRDAQNARNDIYSNNHRWHLENPRKTDIRKLDMRSVDIGLMQINHLFHGRHFESKESLFDTRTNIFYAAKYLRRLLNRHGSIKQAVAHYHSNTDKYQNIYLSHFWPIYQQYIGQRKKV